MGFLADFYHRMIASAVWQSTLSHLSWIDWLAAGAVVLGFSNGLNRPWIKAVRGAAATALTAYATLEFYPIWDRWAGPFLEIFSHQMAEGLSFALLAILILTGLRIVFWLLTFFLERPPASFPATLAAVFFSICSKILLLALTAQVLLLGPWGGMKKAFGQGDSYSGYALAQLARQVHGVLEGPLAPMSQWIRR